MSLSVKSPHPGATIAPIVRHQIDEAQAAAERARVSPQNEGRFIGAVQEHERISELCAFAETKVPNVLRRALDPEDLKSWSTWSQAMKTDGERYREESNDNRLAFVWTPKALGQMEMLLEKVHTQVAKQMIHANVSAELFPMSYPVYDLSEDALKTSRQLLSIGAQMGHRETVPKFFAPEEAELWGQFIQAKRDAEAALSWGVSPDRRDAEIIEVVADKFTAETAKRKAKVQAEMHQLMSGYQNNLW